MRTPAYNNFVVCRIYLEKLIRYYFCPPPTEESATSLTQLWTSENYSSGSYRNTSCGHFNMQYPQYFLSQRSGKCSYRPCFHPGFLCPPGYISFLPPAAGHTQSPLPLPHIGFLSIIYLLCTVVHDITASSTYIIITDI